MISTRNRIKEFAFRRIASILGHRSTSFASSGQHRKSVPPGAHPVSVFGMIRAEVVRSGVLPPPRQASSGPPPKPKPVAKLDEILADLDDSRRDR